jgi:hypothetical protein
MIILFSKPSLQHCTVHRLPTLVTNTVVTLPSIFEKFKNRKSKPEMEFLDIILTKDSSFYLHAIQSPFYRQIFKKSHSSLVLKIKIKNLGNRILKFIHE